jgi:hypothetical protein
MFSGCSLTLGSPLVGNLAASPQPVSLARTNPKLLRERACVHYYSLLQARTFLPGTIESGLS